MRGDGVGSSGVGGSSGGDTGCDDDEDDDDNYGSARKFWQLIYWTTLEVSYSDI